MKQVIIIFLFIIGGFAPSYAITSAHSEPTAVVTQDNKGLVFNLIGTVFLVTGLVLLLTTSFAIVAAVLCLCAIPFFVASLVRLLRRQKAVKY